MQMIITYSEKTGSTCVACVLEIKVETEGRDSSLLLDYAHPHNLNTIIDFHLILLCMFLSSAPWSSECCTMLWLSYQLLAVSIGFCRFLVKLVFSFFFGIIAFGLKGNQGREFQDDMAIISTGNPIIRCDAVVGSYKLLQTDNMNTDSTEILACWSLWC